ncbi:SDR family NAD(P)-dependent oxidoreductase [Allonocardiopsis opalescens]|uniref:Short subunit dehydrogenase n=1 Tax=Allonocardiopsis opalescens TaxID=1144618 RepID=A0A2T0PVI1_9ACTN|nr:SDR family NAD(P)-dependent oxidoreductase [Allonocardiopsis opalescens]PRX95543.1 short subunit dehydrogenase [Allonocardiopsis opalescens]
MKTVVVTGGTDGMGAALVRHYLRNGDRVVAVGRSRAKFAALLASVAADTPSAADRAEFIGADLSLVAESGRVASRIRSGFERVDALVLAASFIRQRRHVTAEGREASWVLFFVSKYVLVTALADRLAAAERPVVVNTSVPGAKAGALDFADLELEHGFTFTRSNARQRRANELLGILATDRNPRLGYVTWGPAKLVKTGFAGEVGPAMKYTAALLAPLVGQSADTAVRPIIELIADPPTGRAAYRGSRRVPLIEGADDPGDAHRLAAAVTAHPTDR